MIGSHLKGFIGTKTTGDIRHGRNQADLTVRSSVDEAARWVLIWVMALFTLADEGDSDGRKS